VLRLTDDDLAERLEKTTGNMISRSVPYLAAPAFATAMLEHQVLRTIDVGRHVLLIAEIRVAEQAGLAGSPSGTPSRTGRPGCWRCRRAAWPRSTGHRTAPACSRPAIA
jgi:hypothetical protein